MVQLMQKLQNSSDPSSVTLVTTTNYMQTEMGDKYLDCFFKQVNKFQFSTSSEILIRCQHTMHKKIYELCSVPVSFPARIAGNKIEHLKNE